MQEVIRKNGCFICRCSKLNEMGLLVCDAREPLVV